MEIKITDGVEIRVSTHFRADLSSVENDSYFFNYEIFIENHNPFSIQLLHRNWYIFDSMNDSNIVSGEGVVGELPILKPYETYSYVSGCELFSELGFMKGYYTFKNLQTGVNFHALIPKFQLAYPPRLN